MRIISELSNNLVSSISVENSVFCGETLCVGLHTLWLQETLWPVDFTSTYRCNSSFWLDIFSIIPCILPINCLISVSRIAFAILRKYPYLVYHLIYQTFSRDGLDISAWSCGNNNSWGFMRVSCSFNLSLILFKFSSIERVIVFP